MRLHLTTMLVALLAHSPMLAQTASGPAGDQAGIVEFAQKAALRAVNFGQGDAEALARARRDFTPDAWREFINHMNGFLDEKGAPVFSSSFAPSGDPVIIDRQEGMIHIKIPGTLTQTQGQSRTIYRNAEIEVRAGGKPLKISQLEQIYKVHGAAPSPGRPRTP